MVARESILDSAFDLLVENGPSFSTASVVGRAGASKGLLFHHFGTREGLLDAMAARVLEETQEGLRRLDVDYPNPRERLAALARTLLEAPHGTPPVHARRVLAFWLQDDATGACRGALRDALLADYVRAVLRDGQATGATRTGADAAGVSTLLLARWHGLTAFYAAGGAPEWDREADALVEEVLARVSPA